MNTVTIQPADPKDAASTALLQESHDLMARLFPAQANHSLSVTALCAEHVAFFAADLNGLRVGCGALSRQTNYAELKSIYVAPTARGCGVGDRLMKRLLSEAQTSKAPKVMLETGTGLDAAHRLYLKFGFNDCGAFGAYEPDAPYSRYMELTL